VVLRMVDVVNARRRTPLARNGAQALRRTLGNRHRFVTAGT